MDDASRSQYSMGHSNAYRYSHRPDRYPQVPRFRLRLGHTLVASRPIGAQAFVPVIGASSQRPADEELLPLLLGRSGKLRAPTFRCATRLIVGYNQALLPLALD